MKTKWNKVQHKLFVSLVLWRLLLNYTLPPRHHWSWKEKSSSPHVCLEKKTSQANHSVSCYDRVNPHAPGTVLLAGDTVVGKANGIPVLIKPLANEHLPLIIQHCVKAKWKGN